jgi:agmatinase
MPKKSRKQQLSAYGPYPGFLGLEPEHSSLTRSRVLVLPVPYECTTSYGQGTRFGPRAIVDASAALELYDPDSGTEPALELGFHTLPPVAPDMDSPREMVDGLAACAAPLYKSGKFVLALGGEHTITAGLVRAAVRQWPDLCILHVDAHADLRNEYQGTAFSHACAARRALDELKDKGRIQLVQVGVRNLAREEHEFIKANPERIRTFWGEEIAADRGRHWLGDIEELVKDRNVYLSFDVDGLDPSIMPATGTPEPGGLDWYDAAELVERVAKAANLVAADLVELAPQYGNRAPDFIAAKLAYVIATRAVSGK